MPFIKAPLRADIGIPQLDREGKLRSISASQSWSQWFARLSDEINRLASLINEQSIGNFSSLKIGGVEVINSSRVADFTALKIGGFGPVIDSSRNADFSSLKIAGTGVIDGSKNITGNTLGIIGVGTLINASGRWVLPFVASDGTTLIDGSNILRIGINTTTSSSIGGVTLAGGSITFGTSGSLNQGGSTRIDSSGTVNGKLQGNGRWVLPFVNSSGGTHIDSGGSCLFANVQATVNFKAPSGATGASGSFTSQDGKTITVEAGIITSIV